VVGDWSIKDVLGHVAAWEQMALRHIDRARGAAEDAHSTGAAVDDYNAAEAERRRGWTLAEVRAEAATTRAGLRAALESVTDDEWSATLARGEEQAPLSDWVGGALGGPQGHGTHADEHAEHIRVWRARRTGAHHASP